MSNEKLYACGKSKTMYLCEDSQKVTMKFLDSVSSYTYNKNERITGTGEVRCDASSKIFELLEGKGIKTHYISNLGNGRMLVNKLDMFKLEVIPRNVAAGSIVRNYPIQLGHKFDPPILKLDMKYSNDPMLNTDYIVALGIATKKEVKIIREIAFTVNDVLKNYFDDLGLLLVDFKFEVGRNSNQEIIIGDEISPDGMRLWDKETKKSLDKDVFRFNSGDLLEAYKELFSRMNKGR